MIIDPADFDRRTLNGLVNGLVAPRPIAWVSTISAAGVRNLAPFSFFNAFSFFPPTIGVGPGSRKGVNKDSLANIKSGGEFVVNGVNRRLAEIANLTSGELPSEVDEWELVDIETAPSETVAPERVAAAPFSLECRVREIVDLGDPEMPTNSLVIAVVQRIHVRDEVMDGMQPDPDRLELVGRLGGDWWTTTRDSFELPRPSTADPDELRAAREEISRREEESVDDG